MPAKPKHYEGDLVERLMDNWARWPGWAGHTGARSTLAWLDDFVSNKRQGDHVSSIPVMGGEAADTHRALGRMSQRLAETLIVYYTWHGLMETRLHRMNKLRASADRISMRTFYSRLEDAHPEFITHYRSARIVAHQVEVKNVAVAVDAGAAVARRHRFVLTAKMGLKSPEEKDEAKQADASVSENGQ